MKTKNINRKFVVLISCMAFVVLCLSIVLLCLTLQKQTVPTADTEDNVPRESAQISYQYVLKAYEGNVGVFAVGEEEPREILDVDLTALPEADQQDLQEGIYIENEASLRQLIEDFDG